MPSDKKFDVPGGQVGFDGKGGYKVEGSGTTIYGDENSLVVYAPGQGVEIIDNHTGEYLDIPGGTLDMNESTDQYPIMSPAQTVFGSKIGVVVVNNDNSAYWLNAETGQSQPIHNAKMTIEDHGGYAVIGTGVSLYGDEFGDIAQTRSGVILYSAVTGERVSIPGGKVTFHDDGTWEVHGNHMSIIGKADGHYTLGGSSTHGHKQEIMSKGLVAFTVLLTIAICGVAFVLGKKSYQKRQARKRATESNDIEPYRDVGEIA